MAHIGIHDIKSQASSFFREKFKNARLALTGASHNQLLAEEATNADPWGPETRTMAALSDAAFEREEYERIVQVLHARLDPNSKRHWRQFSKTLTVLDYLLTHGPGSLSNEFQADISCIKKLCRFNFIDEHGIDRGVGIRNKADHVLELLSKADLWKRERSRAQKISNGIHGFGGSVERADVTTESEKNDSLKAVASGPALAEGKFLHANETSQYSQLNVDSPAEWKPFEKCTTIPSYLRQDDASSPSEKLLSGPAEHNPRVSSAYKKSLSSPSHFRGASPVIWQAFPHSESHASESREETGGSMLLQEANCADKDATPLDETLNMKFKDVLLQDEVALPPRHLSVRRLFDLPKSGIDHLKKKANLHEKEHAKDEDDGVREEKIVGEATQKPFLDGLSSRKPPLLPPPPPSKFRTRIKNHLQHSSLLDL